MRNSIKLLQGVILFFIFSSSIFCQSVGSKVFFKGTDGRSYTGTISEIQNGKYKINYDGYNFSAWLVKQQFSVANNANQSNTLAQAQPTYVAQSTAINSNPQDVQSIFDFGKKQGWASQVYERKLNTYFAGLSAQQKNSIVQLLNQATTLSAKFFALKSLLTGDRYDVTQKFIQQLNTHPESYQQEKCLVTTHNSIIQQWEFSCSVTAVQTYLADLCPRYAWEVKQINSFDAVANNPNHPMAQQQKMLLEKYGGVASARGNFSGKSIAINDALNDFVGKILGVHFYTQQITEPLSSALVKVRSQLDKGFDVPLNISFMGTQARHFILVLKYRNTANGYQYLIYDPWDGVSDYVNESSMLQHSLSPLLTQWKISIDYYYPTQ